jgi:RNA polymerase sigma-70 factor, ECF subfamily
MSPESTVRSKSYMSTYNDPILDETALEMLFREYFNPLCAYCQYRFHFEMDTAKEAVHTGFIKLWENRASIAANSSVKAYLTKIVTNTCLDMLKHDKVRQLHVRHVLQTTPADTCLKGYNPSELKQLTSEIDLAVNELPEQMRKIFELSRYEGLKYAEIAARLNISVKTVETQMSRALVKLRQKLSHYIMLIIMLVLLRA